MDRTYVARFAPSHADGCHVVLVERDRSCTLDVRIIQPSEKTSVLQQLALHKKGKDPVFLPSVAVMERAELARDSVATLLGELAGLERKNLLMGSSVGMEGMTLTGEIHEKGNVLRFQAWTPLKGLPGHQRFFGGLHMLASQHAKSPIAVEALTSTGMLLSL